MSKIVARATLPGSLIALLVAAPVCAQDAGWSWDNSTEFAFVTASGNSSSTTLGLQATLTGETEVDAFKFEIGGIRASSKLTSRTAVGTTGSFTIDETVREEKSAENYFARTRYDRDLGENSFFVFGGAGWERNTFAGYDDRYSFVLGVGDTWVDDDVTLFKTDIGGTYTIQQDVEPTPGKDEGFGGLRANIEFKRALSETTDFTSLLIADENLADTDDLRLDWTSSVSVDLVSGLALKTSYRLLFDNQPALISVPLFDAPGGTQSGSVTIPSKKYDNFVTVSLVISL